MPQGLLDRLKLDHDRLLGMADGLRQVAKLEDPIGEVMSMRKRPNGLIIGKVRVAIGVVGIIFEARPNVTSDSFGLCFKSGNCAILRVEVMPSIRTLRLFLPCRRHFAG